MQPMPHHLRLIVSSALIPTVTPVRASQLWRAAWLCVAGRPEPEPPPLLPETVDEGTVFAAWVSHLRHRLGDRRTPSVRALLSAACWYGLGLPAPATMEPIFGSQVLALRDAGLADDDIVRRLALLVQPPLRH
jgi:hypothetical protein